MSHADPESPMPEAVEDHCTREREAADRPARPRRSWRRHEGGAAAIEFAIIAPVFFFLMFVIAETALVFIAEQVMDNAVFETARLIRTGQVQNAGMSQADFRQQVCDRIAVFINCNSSNFYMDVKSYASFSAMTTSRPLDNTDHFVNPPAFQFGTPNEIVVVRVYYQWPSTPILGHQWLNALSNGRQLIGAWAAFCNEPYGSGTDSQCGPG
jgi:Flp pilus assembly protein TadG